MRRSPNEFEWKHWAEFQIYRGARGRCANPNNNAWENYGGRGIQFRFMSFEQFFAELGPRPKGKSRLGRSLWSIDRVNNEGHYEPGNVRWVTSKQQASNKRKPNKKRFNLVEHLRSLDLPSTHPSL